VGHVSGKRFQQSNVIVEPARERIQRPGEIADLVFPIGACNSTAPRRSVRATAARRRLTSGRTMVADTNRLSTAATRTDATTI
jgi:hypothetical protein